MMSLKQEWIFSELYADDERAKPSKTSFACDFSKFLL
jgi:hypothetical protein